jgi:dCMP deaminase
LLETALLSSAKKRKVGAMLFGIIDEDNTFDLFDSVNHIDRNIFNSTKCENQIGETYECVIHAEEAVIIEMLKSKDYLNYSHKELFVTYSPCMNCCKLIVQAGIDTLYYLSEHKNNFRSTQVRDGISPMNYLMASGVKIVYLSHLDSITKQILGA